jgi:enamine deaminase RidA (YjgF/YER057c/UK114 family)
MSGERTAEHEVIIPPGEEAVYRDLGFGEAVRAGTLIMTAGQVGWDSYATQRFPADLEGQARQAFRNLESVLALAGCAPKDIVHLQFFMVDDSGGRRTLWEDLGLVSKVKHEVLPGTMPCGTAVRVTQLVIPGLLIEIQATAVRPAS